MARTQPTCRPAAAARGPAVLDGLDLDVLAESRVLSVLSTAAAPLPTCAVTLSVDPPYRTAVPAVLERLARQAVI